MAFDRLSLLGNTSVELLKSFSPILYNNTVKKTDVESKEKSIKPFRLMIFFSLKFSIAHLVQSTIMTYAVVSSHIITL